jgi:hypothetical protein
MMLQPDGDHRNRFAGLEFVDIDESSEGLVMHPESTDSGSVILDRYAEPRSTESDDSSDSETESVAEMAVEREVEASRDK